MDAGARLTNMERGRSYRRHFTNLPRRGQLQGNQRSSRLARPQRLAILPPAPSVRHPLPGTHPPHFRPLRKNHLLSGKRPVFLHETRATRRYQNHPDHRRRSHPSPRSYPRSQQPSLANDQRYPEFLAKRLPPDEKRTRRPISKASLAVSKINNQISSIINRKSTRPQQISPHTDWIDD